MDARYTKCTPKDVREWIKDHPLEFPADWTLDEVAEESRRRNLSGRWSGTGIEASRAIAIWSAYKLANFPDFKAPHWDWLTAAGPYAPMDLYSRLIRVLEPAVGAGEAWRTTDAAKSKLLEEIRRKALDLLSIIEVEKKLDVEFADVVGIRPELQPLLDRASEISRRRMLEVQMWARTDRSEPLPPAEFPNFYGGPHLSDYLAALVAKISGQGHRAFPSLSSIMAAGWPQNPDGSTDEYDPDHEPDPDLEVDPEVMSQLLGFNQNGDLDPKLLREGGDFGGAPARQDSLLNAVIKAFPEALFNRVVPPPKVPPASVIEAACIAWFGKSPTQKEINTRIRDLRARLEPVMARTIEHTARFEAWRSEGLTEEEIRRKMFETFLDDE